MEVVNLQQIDDLIREYCTPEWRFMMEHHQEEIEYPKDELIFEEGQEAKRIKVIKTGKVKVYTTDKTGKEQVIRLATDGQIIGHRSFGGDHRYPVSCKALEETVIYHVPLELFQDVLRANHLFCYHFMMFFAEELRASDRHIKNHINMDVRQRMASALIYNLKIFGYDDQNKKKLSYTLSRKDFASLIGTTYETVVRVLGDFDKSGIINIVGKHIEISNQNKLERIRVGS
ncbi:hypothetical protein MNBD_GAMMA26-252 [hydrothermal vent metagenome]|uniref:Transcriptional regulator, Crp/Fnr family n=1 Tax=hydrothermal vent metagenome TaxID=652676 RepID=A0A3B1B3C5_9ZZZZ